MSRGGEVGVCNAYRETVSGTKAHTAEIILHIFHWPNITKAFRGESFMGVTIFFLLGHFPQGNNGNGKANCWFTRCIHSSKIKVKGWEKEKLKSNIELYFPSPSSLMTQCKCVVLYLSAWIYPLPVVLFLFSVFILVEYFNNRVI